MFTLVEFCMNYSVTKNGKPLDKDLYEFDEETKVFTTKENDLVLDFSFYIGITFNTGKNCIFHTCYKCTFNTGDLCTFHTGYNCTFNTGSKCTFSTGYNCTFNTDSKCCINTYNLVTLTLADTLAVIIKNTKNLNETQVYNINDYYRPELRGFQLTEVELGRLKEFPLDEPRLLMLHKYDELGKRLFEHYRKKGLL